MTTKHDVFEAAIDVEMETGRRESTREVARTAVLWRIARMSLATALLVVGLLLLVLPGPGMVVVIAGLALLARDVQWAARLLDKAKARSDAVTGGRTKHFAIAGGLLSLGAVAAAMVSLFL